MLSVLSFSQLLASKGNLSKNYNVSVFSITSNELQCKIDIIDRKCLLPKSGRRDRLTYTYILILVGQLDN